MSRVLARASSGDICPEFAIDQSNWDHPPHLAIGQLSMEKLFDTLIIGSGQHSEKLPVSTSDWPLYSWRLPDPLRAERTLSSDQFLNRRLYNDALLIVHQGKVVHESYRNGVTDVDRHVIHSCSKSLISILVQQGITRELLSLQAPITDYVPSLKAHEAWEGVTLEHVWDMQAGIRYSENYSDPVADYWSYARAAGYYPTLDGQPAVGIKRWITENLRERQHKPGEVFVYNSCLTNVLGMALETVYQQSLADIFEENFYARIGAEQTAYFNTDSLGFPIAEGQISLCLRDFARCAWPLMNGGRSLSGELLLDASFPRVLATPVQAARRAYHRQQPDQIFASGQYTRHFWGVDCDQSQFAMLGIHGQFAWFDLEQDVFAVGFGSYPEQDGVLMMACLKELWRAISDAAGSL